MRHDARVAIGSQRHVAAGHDEFEFFRSGLAENCDRLLSAPRLAAGVFLQLADERRIPFGIDQPFENIVNDVLLFLRVEVAADMRFGDLPVIRYMRAQ